MDEVSRIKTIYMNLEIIITPVVLIAVGVVVLITLAKCIRGRKVYFNMPRLITNMIIAAMPFIWIAITTNHAYIHYWMVYKNFSISVFAAACMMVSLVYDKDNKLPNVAGKDMDARTI